MTTTNTAALNFTSTVAAYRATHEEWRRWNPRTIKMSARDRAMSLLAGLKRKPATNHVQIEVLEKLLVL